MTHLMCRVAYAVCLAGLAGLFVASGMARAAADETLTLREDLVLTGNERLEIVGTKDKPCTIEGRHFRIRSKGKWTGQLKLTHCKIKQLGARPVVEADRLKANASCIELVSAGKGAIVVEDCTFDECNGVVIQNNDDSTTHCRRNVFLPNALVPVNKAAHLSAACFMASGSSQARKFFQGNRVGRGGCGFVAPNWLVGGAEVGEGNLFIGYRCGVFAMGPGTVFKGNYVHVDLSINDDFPFWSQVSTFGGSSLAEHNVIRTGHWVLRGLGGEFRHNLVLEAHGHNLLQAGTAKVHHNIFAHSCPLPDSKMNPKPISGVSAVNQVYPQDRLEIYNNTFHGPGLGLAVELHPNTVMPSLRNNLFYDFRTKIVVLAHLPKQGEMAGRLGYADFNCFFCPKVPEAICYGAVVDGKAERKDAGFALNDLPKGGKINQQVDPKLQGPIPEKFPFADEDIKTGKVTVGQILKFYRDAFTPAPGSPLIDAGDPADGAGTDIGAVDAGKPAQPSESKSP